MSPAKPIADPRMPAPRDCVVRALIDRRAEETPDKVYVLFEDGSSWTYAELRRQVLRVAAGLQNLGVRQDDFVLAWLPNGQHLLALWYALNYLGAVWVPINTAYRGGLLQHVIANSDARLMVADARLVARLADIERAQLNTVVVVGGAPSAIAGLQVLPESALTDGTAELKPLEREIAPWDTISVIYTSGTTGPSKGVLCSYLHFHASSSAFHFIGADDRNLVNLPMFHVGGAGPAYRMLAKGGSIAIVESFNTQTFWDTVRRTEITSLTVLGAMASFLVNQPAPVGAPYTLRKANVVPLNDEAMSFAARFGIEYYTTFNMTEICCPIFSTRNPTVAGSCGTTRPGFAARVVDQHDCEVAPGTVGELMVRSDMPWAMNHGYHKNAEATARAWRNGWFHTGDAFRRDADGNFFFVDRIKDAIRRRGENISSFEVEAEICAHQDVREAAVVAAPSEHGEDEVLAIVAPVPGRTIDPAAMIEFLRPRLAHFMIPRFIRIVPDLPKTPTQKVQKHELRAEGVTADTWDREKAGVVVKRERLAAGKLSE